MSSTNSDHSCPHAVSRGAFVRINPSHAYAVYKARRKSKTQAPQPMRSTKSANASFFGCCPAVC